MNIVNGHLAGEVNVMNAVDIGNELVCDFEKKLPLEFNKKETGNHLGDNEKRCQDW